MIGFVSQVTEITRVIISMRSRAGKKGGLKLREGCVDVIENTRSGKRRKGACVDVDENK